MDVDSNRWGDPNGEVAQKKRSNERTMHPLVGCRGKGRGHWSVPLDIIAWYICRSWQLDWKCKQTKNKTLLVTIKVGSFGKAAASRSGHRIIICFALSPSTQRIQTREVILHSRGELLREREESLGILVRNGTSKRSRVVSEQLQFEVAQLILI